MGIQKYLYVGPGGFKCFCCAPAPGKRRQMFRTARRKEKREAFKIEEMNRE